MNSQRSPNGKIRLLNKPAPKPKRAKNTPDPRQTRITRFVRRKPRQVAPKAVKSTQDQQAQRKFIQTTLKDYWKPKPKKSNQEVEPAQKASRQPKIQNYFNSVKSVMNKVDNRNLNDPKAP